MRYYPENDAPEVDGKDFKLEVGGLVDDKNTWTLEELYALPQETQITRHICVEGWSAIGKWTGVRLARVPQRIGADTRAKYVWFQCAEGYSNTHRHGDGAASADADDLQIRRRDFAAQIRLPDEVRMPTKLGFKNPKYVIGMHVTNKDLGGYWEDQGYNWHSGL